MNSRILLSIFTIVIIIAKWEVCNAIEPLTFAVTSIVGLIYVGTSFIPFSRDESYQPRLLTSLDNLHVDEDILNIERKLENILEIIPKQLNLDIKLDSLNQKVHRIDEQFSYMYERMKAYHNHELNREEIASLYDDSEDYFHNREDLPYGLIKSIYNTLLTGSRSILNDLDILTKSSEFSSCSRGSELQTLQQSFLKLLTSIAVSQVKVILTIKMSDQFLHMYTGEYRRTTVNLITDDLNDNFIKAMKSFKKIMSNASRDVWRCDPKEHKEGLTYIELKNTFQKQLVYESMTNAERGDPQPKDIFREPKCPVPDDNSQETVYDTTARNLYTVRLCHYSHKCQGLLRNCRLVRNLLNLQEDEKIGVCYSLPETGRRFDRFDIYNQNYEYSKTYGKNEQCGPRNKQSLEYVEHDFYACTCEESRRYFYKGLVSSNYNDNYVITGVRLAQREGVIYPIIQQGLLLEEGVIDQSSVHWVDIGERVQFNASNVFQITWSSRSVQLGVPDIKIPSDIHVPSNAITIMTGIQLGPLYGNPDEPLTLTYDSRLFDFTTGKPLSVQNTDFENSVFRTTATGTEDPRDIINVENLRVPDSTLKSDVIVQDEKRIKFSESNFETDLGQTTIPFLDIQSVTTYPATPMVAGGFYYKYRQGFGGYFAVKLKSLDMLPYLVVPDKDSLKYVDGSVLDKLKLKNGRLGTYFNENF